MSVEASVNNKKNSQGLLKKAARFAMGTTASRILGLFRDLAMAALFDRTITDAWAAAFRLPNFFRRLFGEGSVAASFTPLWVAEEQKINADLRYFENQILLFMFWVLLILSFIFIVAAEPLLKVLLDPVFVQDALRFGITLKMSQVLGVFVLFVGLSGFFSAWLQIKGEFGWTGFSPVLLNLVMIAFTVMPLHLVGGAPVGLALGAVLGSVAQLVFLVWRATIRGWSFEFKSFHSSLDKTIIVPFVRHLPLGFIGVGFLQLLMLVNTFVASSLAQGSLSYLYWADRLLELPLTLVTVSLGTAVLPELTKSIRSHRKQDFAANVEHHLLISLGIIVPAAVGLGTLSELIVRLLFYRGEFLLQDVVGTTGVLRISAGLLILQSIYRLLVPVFLAAAWGRWLFRSLLLGLSFHLAVLPSAAYHWGLRGVIGVSVLSLLLVVLMMSYKYISVYGWDHQSYLNSELSKILFSSVVMGAFLYLLESTFIASAWWWQWGSFIFGIMIYFLMLLWLRSRVLRFLMRSFY